MGKLYAAAARILLKPYIKRELPGWGFLYSKLIGDYRRDYVWKDEPERWVRGKLHGYEMSVRIEGWSNRASFFLERFYDLPTQLLMQRLLLEGDTFVDVGANEGMMTLLGSSLVGDRGKVIAFEPNPAPRGHLEKAISRNGIRNVELHPVGLSDAPDELKLFVPFINTGEGSFTGVGMSEGESLTCSVVAGDAALAGIKPKLIKIDVEGFETRVLKGLEQTLRNAKPVLVMEMIAGHLSRDGSSPAVLIELLESHGYRGARLEMDGRKKFKLSPMPQPWRDGDYVWKPISS